MEKAEAYRELERLKRMDEHRMYYYIGEITFIYVELGARIEMRQDIFAEEHGKELASVQIEKPMNREEFEEFCKEVIRSNPLIELNRQS